MRLTVSPWHEHGSVGEQNTNHVWISCLARIYTEYERGYDGCHSEPDVGLRQAGLRGVWCRQWGAGGHGVVSETGGCFPGQAGHDSSLLLLLFLAFFVVCACVEVWDVVCLVCLFCLLGIFSNLPETPFCMDLSTWGISTGPWAAITPQTGPPILRIRTDARVIPEHPLDLGRSAPTLPPSSAHLQPCSSSHQRTVGTIIRTADHHQKSTSQRSACFASGGLITRSLQGNYPDHHRPDSGAWV